MCKTTGKRQLSFQDLTRNIPASTNNATPLPVALLPLAPPLAAERPIPAMGSTGARRYSMARFTNEHRGSRGSLKDVVYALVEE